MTEKFEIDGYSSITLNILNLAVKRSSLPEGVTVVQLLDDYQQINKPFVVLAPKFDTKKFLDAYEAGALKVRIISHDVDVMVERLNLE